MPRTRPSRPRIPLALAIFLSSATPPALAQYPAGATVQQLPSPDDPAELLAQALRTLATEPSNIPALTAAGRNALVLGDPNAAVGFFGRASELAPRDGQVKAGLGSALVQLEKPADALRLFGEASALGVPDADLAEDRGLAYDLTGDNRRAQQDYRTALAVHPDDDTARRRLALSQGIAGDKAGAIATLDPLIRKRDIAGWRAQTFVLAMNGDAAGAGSITHIMMPQQADRMQPFLVRLSSLSPADKARAVHFGEMPQGGSAYTPTQLATANAPATYASAPTQTVATPPVKPARHRSQVAAVTPAETGAEPSLESGDEPEAPVRPKREAPRRETPATPPPAPQVAFQTAPKPQPALPPKAEPVAAPEATTTGNPRFVGPPADVVPKSEPPAAQTARPQVALESTPAPLAATAFGTTGDATSTVAAVSPPVPSTAVTSTPTSAPATAVAGPAVSTRAGVAAFDATSSSPVAGAPPPAAAAPTAAAALPMAAPAGHFDLPHETTASQPLPESARVGTPVVHQPNAPPGRAAEERPAVAVKARPAKVEVADAPPVAEKAIKGHHASHGDEETTASTTGKGRKSSDSGSSEPARKGSHSKATRTADADDSDATPANGKRQSGRKGKSDDTATTDTMRADDKKAGNDTESSARGRTKKGGRSDEGGSGLRKHGREADSAAPKVYVQVAGGANKDDMDKAWANVKAKAPDLMKGHTPSTTPLNATNRLLVGPFKDDKEAQAFVNKMAGKGLSGFTFKSAKGQKVEKVDAGK